MAKSKAVHFKRGNGTYCNYYAPASGKWSRSCEPKEVTCQTCKDVHKRHFGDALTQVNTIANHSGMSRAEILEWYAKTKLDPQKVRHFSSGIGNIVGVITGGMLSDEEFEAELDKAIVEDLMKE